ncbi:dihydroneopterin aldolase [Plastoroseomonas arctica]|uniref:dihydroneopterin aldolase n=1 Tax=Plastoroseomonas arctica TaxID=1509237 RepID=UPI0034619B6E
MSGFAPDAARGLRRVFLRGLEARARLGVHAHEKAGPQRIIIGIELAVEDADVAAGIGVDHLSRVVDYERVVMAARSIASGEHVLLVETLAERIALAALADPKVVAARVQIEKPDAFPDVVSVGVVVERTRPPC